MRARELWENDIRTLTGAANPRLPMMEMRERADGLLLISGVGLRAAPQPGAITLLGQRPLGFEEALRPHHTSQFEIVDLREGVLASTRIDMRYLRLIDDRFAFRCLYDASGFVKAEI
jgi:hypothetical protein